MQSPEATVAKLEQRIKRMEDIEAIKNLKNRYVFSIDTGRLEDAIATFSEKAVADYGVLGLYKGRKAIGDFLTAGSTFSVHHLHNPQIEIVTDTTAKGTWELQAMIHLVATDKAYWMVGYYTDEYVKERGGWKQGKFQITWQTITEYEQGWVKQRMAM